MKQFRLLKEMFNKVFVLFDNDEQAQGRAEEFHMMLLSLGVDSEIITIEKNDPGSLSDRETRKIMAELEIN